MFWVWNNIESQKKTRIFFLELKMNQKQKNLIGKLKKNVFEKVTIFYRDYPAIQRKHMGVF